MNDLIDYLTPISPAAAARVPDAVQRLRERLSAAPGVGERVRLKRRPHFAGLRMTPLPIRRYMAYFVVTPSAVEIVRILHSARDRNRILKDDF